jgi:hypothetical protein
MSATPSRPMVDAEFEQVSSVAGLPLAMSRHFCQSSPSIASPKCLGAVGVRALADETDGSRITVRSGPSTLPGLQGSGNRRRARCAGGAASRSTAPSSAAPCSRDPSTNTRRGPSSTGTWFGTTRTVHPAVSADLAPVLESSIAKHDAVTKPSQRPVRTQPT